MSGGVRESGGMIIDFDEREVPLGFPGGGGSND